MFIKFNFIIDNFTNKVTTKMKEKLTLANFDPTLTG